MKNNNEKAGLSRPFPLMVLCMISFVYNGLIAISFLTALFFPSFIEKILSSYFPEISLTKPGTIAILVAGFLLFALTFFGVLQMFRLKRYGFYIFLIFKSILIILLFMSHYYNLINIGISLLIILLYWLYLPRMKS
ncbi:MAG: hypothetical protein K9G67_00610 [Bacteroidales bacterium]|nr:hypothetical protein [Bacteroidales bacterium]MCF8352315.1 hypothetical protein [Bacteroidales bacterium]MCF8374832.1 hypothetical protein [Bacteroidales bacterium]